MAQLLLLLMIGLVLAGPRLDEDGLARQVHISDILAAPFVIWVVLRSRQEVRRLLGSRLVKTVAAFLLYCTGSIALAAGIGRYPWWAAAVFVAREAEIWAYLIVAAALVSGRRPLVLRTVLGAGIGITAIVTYQVVTSRYLGYYGFVGLPNEAGPSQGGGVLGITVVMLFWVLLTKKWNGIQVGAILAVIAVAGMGLVLTLSRGGILSAACGIVAILLLSLRYSLHKSSQPILIGALVLSLSLGAIAITASNLPGFVARVGTRISARNFEAEDRPKKWAYVMAYDQGGPVARVIGYGLGSPNFLLFDYDQWGLILLIDSQYVRRLFELGIAGTGLWLSTIVFMYLRVARPRNAPADQALPPAAGFVAITVFMLVLSVTHEAFQVAKVGLSYGIYAGLLLGAVASRGKAAGATPAILTIVYECQPLRSVKYIGALRSAYRRRRKFRDSDLRKQLHPKTRADYVGVRKSTLDRCRKARQDDVESASVD